MLWTEYRLGYIYQCRWEIIHVFLQIITVLILCLSFLSSSHYFKTIYHVFFQDLSLFLIVFLYFSYIYSELKFSNLFKFRRKKNKTSKILLRLLYHENIICILYLYQGQKFEQKIKEKNLTPDGLQLGKRKEYNNIVRRKTWKNLL